MLLATVIVALLASLLAASVITSSLSNVALTSVPVKLSKSVLVFIPLNSVACSGVSPEESACATNTAGGSI